MTDHYAVREGTLLFHPDPRNCPHYNEHVCPTCDHDGYYATKYPSCPWRKDD